MGTTKSVRKVPSSSPPTMTQPICWRDSDPAPGRERERHRAQHHGARGHEDRAQPQDGGLLHRLQHALALGLHLVGELDDQDAVLGDEAHQRDEADLAVDVERAARELEGEERPRHRQRHREHDHEGIDEALELRREHQVDEREGQHEHEVDVRGGIAELARLAVQVGLGGGRQHLPGRLLHEGERLAQGVAGRQRGGDRHGADAVEVVQALGRHALAHRHQVRELDHLVALAAHVDVGDVAGRAAVGVGHLHHHVVLLAVALEARDLPAARASSRASCRRRPRRRRRPRSCRGSRSP